MKKKLIGILLTACVSASLLNGCSEINYTPAADAAVEEVTKEAEEGSQTEDDQAKADEVAALIDAIYVQERTDSTDDDCRAAKEAWDGLTDEQKELVEGENADPDYFGRDTGDASKDDPANADDIGDKEILVVSFGTSFNDSRAEDIGGIEKAIAEAYDDWSVRRAFTAQIIINHVQARDEEFIDNMDQALERAVANEVKELVVQPTHLMHGAEYDEMVEAVEAYRDKFDKVYISEPLLGQVGDDAGSINEDKEAVCEAVVKETVADSDFESPEDMDKDETAIVYIGHGTSHTAKVTYSQMQTQMDELGYKNVFVGTVEGEPEETACENIIEAVHDKGYKKVIMRPLMVVAGDHANNDMAGDDDDSWKSLFEASGYFDELNMQIAGLGRIKDVQQRYVEHIADVLEGDAEAGETKSKDKAAAEDGEYLASFETDSSMFHVNEAWDGKGVLKVKDGKMTIHIVMPSKNVVNLFYGSAKDAEKDGAELIEPEVEEVTYDDGTTEEVYAFDVPVPALDEEFDVALIGKKKAWYDHKVKVSDPEPYDGKISKKGAEKKTLKDSSDEEGLRAEVTLTGGSGRALVTSPAKIREEDGKIIATVEWSSPNYDYMIVDGKKYEPVNTEGNSVFEIPIPGYDEDITVIADTVAMSKPHEIEYVLKFKKQ